MALLPHNDAEVDSELEKFILGHEALKPGDKLSGKIIQVKPGGKILVDFGKFRAVARSQFPCKEGEIIHVIVVAKRPKLKLRLEVSAGNKKMLDVNV